MEYAQCMRHVLAAVNSSDLVALLEQTRLTSEEQVGHADSEAAGQFSKYIFSFLVLVSWKLYINIRLGQQSVLLLRYPHFGVS